MWQKPDRPVDLNKSTMRCNGNDSKKLRNCYSDFFLAKEKIAHPMRKKNSGER